jgi:Uma2 family endonuclease
MTTSSQTADPFVVLYDVSWQTYEGILDALGEYQLRHTYDRGTLEIVCPHKEHFWVKSLLNRMVSHLAYDCDIPIQSIGSTTLTSEAVERGLQPDEAYYIANEPLVRGKPQYEPDRDPPPDLVVEVDVTNSSVRRLPTFAAMKVPEVWRYDGDRLHFLRLGDSGQYIEASTSAAFPFLTPQDVARFLDERTKTDENSLIRSFLEWARQRATKK